MARKHAFDPSKAHFIHLESEILEPAAPKPGAYKERTTLHILTRYTQAEALSAALQVLKDDPLKGTKFYIVTTETGGRNEYGDVEVIMESDPSPKAAARLIGHVIRASGMKLDAKMSVHIFHEREEKDTDGFDMDLGEGGIAELPYYKSGAGREKKLYYPSLCISLNYECNELRHAIADYLHKRLEKGMITKDYYDVVIGDDDEEEKTTDLWVNSNFESENRTAAKRKGESMIREIGKEMGIKRSNRERS